MSLFAATESWNPPALRPGLLYVCQNSRGAVNGGPRRVLGYDLRAPG